MEMSEFYEKLYDLMLDGEEDEAGELAEQAIEEGTEPIAIVNEALVPILNDFGDKFSKLELFLPDLIMAADVATVVKDVVRDHLTMTGNTGSTMGKVVIGTMQGDVHDIGKNIVATLLEVNGYEVFDLGNDVAPYAFIETAKRENCDIIALSSLLTTSMPYMPDLIQTLDGLGIRDKFKVIVGGGPVSAEWAEKIGADGYSNDANEAVKLCNKIMEERKA